MQNCYKKRGATEKEGRKKAEALGVKHSRKTSNSETLHQFFFSNTAKNNTKITFIRESFHYITQNPKPSQSQTQQHNTTTYPKTVRIRRTPKTHTHHQIQISSVHKHIPKHTRSKPDKTHTHTAVHTLTHRIYTTNQKGGISYFLDLLLFTNIL